MLSKKVLTREEIINIYKRKKKIEITYTVIVMFALPIILISMIVFTGNKSIPLPGFVKYILMALLLGLVGVLQWCRLCPACNYVLGKRFHGTKCPKCGADFR